MIARCSPKLLHGQERRVGDDSAYSGQCEMIRRRASQAQSFIQSASAAEWNGADPEPDEKKIRGQSLAYIRSDQANLRTG